MTISRYRMVRMIGFFVALWAFSALGGDRIYAQSVPEELENLCTFAGGADRIYIDPYSCEGDITPTPYCLFVGYDPETKQLYPYISYDCMPETAGPYEPDVMVMLQSSTEDRLEVLFEKEEGPSAVLTGDRYCGGAGLTRFGLRFSDGEEMDVGEGMVVDTDGDRMVDAVRLMINPGSLAGSRAGKMKRLLKSTPAVVMTEPLTYYDDGDDHYWVIPCVDGNSGQRIFVPVDSMHNLSVQCGDQSAMISSEAAVDGDGDCLLPIPTLTGWGYAGLIFLILVSGIWMMRRTGFGRGLTKS